MRYIECFACKKCWIKSRKKVYQSHQNYADESNALLVGGLYTQNFDGLCSRGRRKNMFERKNAKKKKEVQGQKNVLLHTGSRRNLKKSLPYVRKSVMTYNNPQISKMWRDVWNKKEESLSICFVKSLENISENTKSLPPLNCGDHVVILNRTGNFPSKWGNSGVVVEVKDCHQCVVKVDGSGRLTAQNRKFLRRFTPPLSSIPYL